ncbi:MAG: protein kinase [Oligoflexia bacterium]|nr:protein kinase [Oligoflexia bacterium]
MKKRFVFVYFIAISIYLSNSAALYAAAATASAVTNSDPWHLDVAKLQIVCTAPEGQAESCQSLDNSVIREALLAEWLPFMQQQDALSRQASSAGQRAEAAKSAMKIEYFLRLNEDVLRLHFNSEVTQYFDLYTRNIQRINSILPDSYLTQPMLLEKMHEVILNFSEESSAGHALNAHSDEIVRIDYDGSETNKISAMLTAYDIVIPYREVQSSSSADMTRGRFKKINRVTSLRVETPQVLVHQISPGDPESFLNMSNELHIHQKLFERNVPNVAINRYYRVDSDKKEVYVVRDYHTETLSDLLNRIHYFAVLNPVLAVDMALQQAKILQVLHHAGFRHKDIKLDNFFVDNLEKVILSDFDFCYVLGDQATEHQRHMLSGSVQNVSPFYLKRPRNVDSIPADQCYAIDAANDIWGLGVVFFEMLFSNSPDFTTTALYSTDENKAMQLILTKIKMLAQSASKDDVRVVLQKNIEQLFSGPVGGFIRSHPNSNLLVGGISSIILRMLRVDYRQIISIDQIVLELDALKERMMKLEADKSLRNSVAGSAAQES